MRNKDEFGKLYLNYARLGYAISNQKHKHNVSFLAIWRKIAKEGFWKAAISRQYGGIKIGWEGYLIALEGLSTTYFDHELCSYILRQISALYFLINYSNEYLKSLFVPRIISGEILSITFPESNPVYKFEYAELLITNYKINGVCTIYIEEKNTKKKFHVCNVHNSALIYTDLINFEKIMVKKLTINYSKYILNKYKNKFVFTGSSCLNKQTF